MSKITIDRSVVEQALNIMTHMLALDLRNDYNLLTVSEYEMIRAEAVKLRENLEQPQVEQEPVAWEGRDGYLYHFIEEPKPGDRPLYTHPQPPRQPLTEMDIVNLRQLVPGTLDVQFVKFARVIEAAHGIKEQK